MERTEEVRQAIEAVEEALELTKDLIAVIDSPIGLDQTIEYKDFTVRIILNQKDA